MGYSLYYSRGTSLIERIRYQGAYEEQLSTEIITALRSFEQPIFLDVGANIGLITLNILASVRCQRVYAFEPGPHQAGLLEKTIRKNNLATVVILHKVGLSEQIGTARFAIHQTGDASGDGFLDTGRAGGASYVNVPVTTLNAWWEAAGRPCVSVAKLDAEGAELWILRGGDVFLDQCRPIIFLEICTANLRVYPYTAIDILCWLNQREYTLHTLDGSIVDEISLKERVITQESYVAYPRKVP